MRNSWIIHASVLAITTHMLLLAQPATGQSGSAKPDDSQFTKIVLDDDLNELMEVAVANDDGSARFVFGLQRNGGGYRHLETAGSFLD